MVELLKSPLSNVKVDSSERANVIRVLPSSRSRAGHLKRPTSYRSCVLEESSTRCSGIIHEMIPFRCH